MLRYVGSAVNVAHFTSCDGLIAKDSLLASGDGDDVFESRFQYSFDMLLYLF